MTGRRILVCGSREWTDRDHIRDVLLEVLKPGDVIVHGDYYRGADRIARELADELGFEQDPFAADWERHGRRAGPIRNKEMVDSGLDLAVAFSDGSPGTADAIRRARAANVPVRRERSRERTEGAA